ncbi:MAG: hypothetical protein FJY80_11445, partial [Candidatus Aminicenantes bacterium]|nr:hypothetical protein [Candidatus Aminicenantes bacterium]
MTGRPAIPAAVIVAALSAASAAEQPPLQKLVLPGIPVEISARSFQPGEVLLARLADDPLVRRAVVRFLGQSLTLEPAGAGRTPFGLLG